MAFLCLFVLALLRCRLLTRRILTRCRRGGAEGEAAGGGGAAGMLHADGGKGCRTSSGQWFSPFGSSFGATCHLRRHVDRVQKQVRAAAAAAEAGADAVPSGGICGVSTANARLIEERQTARWLNCSINPAFRRHFWKQNYTEWRMDCLEMSHFTSGMTESC